MADVVLQDNGIIKNASKNTIIVDLSTTLANETVNFSNKVSTEKGASWIDAPMSGGPDKALNGSPTTVQQVLLRRMIVCEMTIIAEQLRWLPTSSSLWPWKLVNGWHLLVSVH